MSKECQSLVLMWLRVLAILIFMFGFFPLKKPVPGVADVNDFPDFSHKNLSLDWNRKVGRLVIVLIDALRADFVISHEDLSIAGIQYGKESEYPKIEYLARKISQGEARAYAAKATPPTVTLPRLKALTTGTIPGFVDVILNFGSSELTEDSLIGQLHRNDRKLIFFGDDTWIKLFPNQFERSEGTTSFFVSDYTEVDQNVTRNLNEELDRDDWDVMILHYLGLDHIGHLAGPSSPLVAPKLKEMGDVIKRIQDKVSPVQSWKNGLPPLILVLGDHGMSDYGSHGGASVSETMTPIVAMGPLMAHKNKPVPDLINQQDIVPTLAYLTGVPIPRNNLGVLISGMIQENPEDGQLSLLYNGYQLSKVMESNLFGYADYESYQQFQECLLQPTNMRNLLSKSITGMSERLADNLLEYNLSFLYGGIMLALLVTFGSIYISSGLFNITPVSRFLIAFELLKIFSLGSTSFIEEQHQTMYFLLQTIFILFLHNEMKKKDKTAKMILLLTLVMGLVRMARCLNQTGDKWAHIPDLSDYLHTSENINTLSIIHALSLLILAAMTIYKLEPHNPFSYAIGAAFALVYIYNAIVGKVSHWHWIISDSNGIREAQMVYSLSSIYAFQLIFAKTFKEGCEILTQALIPVLILLGSPENATLFVFLHILAECVKNLASCHDKLTSTLVLLHIGQSMYFLQGNSNSLASVDVAAGYTGMSDYNLILTGTLITLNLFSGPLMALIISFTNNSPVENLAVINVTKSLETLFFLALATSQRYHLFVWTVFSPKILHIGSLDLFMSFVISILCSLKIIIKYLPNKRK